MWETKGGLYAAAKKYSKKKTSKKKIQKEGICLPGQLPHRNIRPRMPESPFQSRERMLLRNREKTLTQVERAGSFVMKCVENPAMLKSIKTQVLLAKEARAFSKAVEDTLSREMKLLAEADLEEAEKIIHRMGELIERQGRVYNQIVAFEGRGLLPNGFSKNYLGTQMHTKKKPA